MKHISGLLVPSDSRQAQGAVAVGLQAVVRRPVRFTIDDANRAGDEWRFNCGPGAICAICNLTPSELRPHMGDFESKGYTNPTLMWQVLDNLGARWQQIYRGDLPAQTPKLKYGLMRVQWAGPWTKPGVPMRARYRETHWVAARNDSSEIFDINAMCAGP